MLSYQHIYHAGNAADIHKHRALAEILDRMTARGRPVSYFETHAGRALYDLESTEALKTGEAARGWLKIAGDARTLADLPESYVSAVRGVNDGALGPNYPGSPLLAASILRAQDRLHLFELHPKEHAALSESVLSDRRISVYRADGYEGVLSLVPPPRNAGLVLVDPSYEVKSEYGQAAEFAAELFARWRDATLLIWYPLLPAGRHEHLLSALRKHFGDGDLTTSETCWSDPSSGRGMYGSGLARVCFTRNVPGSEQNITGS